MKRAVLVMVALLWACTDGNPDSGYRDGQGGEGGAGGAGGQGGSAVGGEGGSAGEGGTGGEAVDAAPDATPEDAAPEADALEPGWTADGQWTGWPAAPEGSERNGQNVLCHPRCGCASATLGIPGAPEEAFEVETGSIHDFPLHVRFGTCGPIPGVEVISAVTRIVPQGADTTGTEISALLTDANGDSVVTLAAGETTFEFWLQAHLDVPGVELLHLVRVVPAAR